MPLSVDPHTFLILLAQASFNVNGEQTMTVLCEDKDHGITHLTLRREPVNALNTVFLTDVEHKLTAIEKDARVRAVVISSGLSVFSAGMDLKEARGFSDVEQSAMVTSINQTFFRLFSMSKPVVAVVNGAAIAGGLFFVLASDYAVAREDAKLGLAEVRVGVNFPIVPLEIARAALAPNVIRRIMLSGQYVDAVSASKMGIVDEVSSAENLLIRAFEVARDYATIPPIAYARVKAQMRAQSVQTMAQALKQKTDPTLAGWFTDETRSAMARALACAKHKG